jgi:hypothetical protein
MNLQEIAQQYSTAIGRMNDSLEASYDRIRENFDLSDAERAASALEAHSRAVDASWEAIVEQSELISRLDTFATKKRKA